MKPKFRVSLDVQEKLDVDREEYYSVLESVTPESFSLKCPHCDVYSTMHIESSIKRLDWEFDLICTCTHCEQSVFAQVQYNFSQQYNDIASADSTSVIAIFPQNRNVNIPPEVPEKYRINYGEAILVLDLSPKASAALSRRILQTVIREKFNITPKNLDKEIDDFIKLKDVPSGLAKSVDAIRHVGNFAAHPLKYTNTGEIVEVEPGEAEWLLDILEQLFDFAFVRPKKLEEQINKLNAKLQSAGKPILKTPTP